MSAIMVQTVPQLPPPAGVDLGSYDDEQVRLMEERCILVTPADEAYGEDSKKTCESWRGGFCHPAEMGFQATS